MTASSTFRWFCPSLATALLLGLAGCDADPMATNATSSDASDDASDAVATDAASSSSDVADAADVSGTATLSLPQFIHGAARVNTSVLTKIPIVVRAIGATPDSLTVTVGSLPPVTATTGPHGWVANVDLSSASPGILTVTATAQKGGATMGSVSGKLTVASDSLQYTVFATHGQAYSDHLVRDVGGDRLAYTWIDAPTTHALHLAYLDGAFARIGSGSDVTLNDAADEPLSADTAFGQNAIGVVYRTAKAGDVHWSVKMRVTDATGAERAKVMDLTGAGAAFSPVAAGSDASGFSAAWLHIKDGTSPVELRFARWDLGTGKLLPTITLDSDQPAATASSGAQVLEPLAEIHIACNTKICVVAYVRDVYHTGVMLNEPKVHLAVVDIKTNALVATPKPVEAADWDSQLFGHHLIALDDGTFALVYQAVDTVAAVTPKSTCDSSLERDLLFATKLDANGAPVGSPKAIFDFQGSRQFPRLSPHVDGFALFWEDQREECGSSGHIRMSANVTPPDLSKLLDAYAATPGSIGLPPEYPTVSVAGPNVVYAWSDNRHGLGLTDPKNELYLDTDWRP